MLASGIISLPSLVLKIDERVRRELGRQQSVWGELCLAGLSLSVRGMRELVAKVCSFSLKFTPV